MKKIFASIFLVIAFGFASSENYGAGGFADQLVRKVSKTSAMNVISKIANNFVSKGKQLSDRAIKSYLERALREHGIDPSSILLISDNNLDEIANANGKTIAVNERQFSGITHGEKRIITLHEASHIAHNDTAMKTVMMPLVPFMIMYSKYCEKRSDEDAMRMVGCWKCIEEWIKAGWTTNSGKYFDEADCRKWMDSFKRDGSLCFYHSC